MRLLIVSNRLPVTVVEEEGKLKCQKSVRGLATGLSSYLNRLKNSSLTKSKYIWMGWPGAAVNSNMKKELISKLLTKFNSYPVFIPKKLWRSFTMDFATKQFGLFFIISPLTLFMMRIIGCIIRR